MEAHLVIRLGDVEVEFEGSEEYLRDQLPELLRQAVELHGRDDAGREVQPKNESATTTDDSDDAGNGTTSSRIRALADEIGVEEELVRGSMDPSRKAPHLRIDKYYWAALKKNTPKTGPNAIPPATLAATLMTLWFDQADLGDVSLEQIREALRESDLRVSRIKRAINNCPWLQLRGSRVAINPAEVSPALDLAKAFCTKSEPSN